MMNAADLDTLDLWEAYPAEHRLAAAIESALSGEDYQQRVAELSKLLGYSKPNAVALWLKHAAVVPHRHLPAIANYLGIHLSVLVTFWLATFTADDDEAGVIASSIRPRITDAEFDLIETARAIYQDEADDRSEP